MHEKVADCVIYIVHTFNVINCYSEIINNNNSTGNVVNFKGAKRYEIQYTLFFYKKPIALAELRGFLKFQLVNLIFS